MNGRGGWIAVFVIVALSAAGCVSSTDLSTLEADVNVARRVAFENRNELRDLKQRIGEVGSDETPADLTDIAEAFKNIRASQADLYRRLEDLERSFQVSTGQTEETSFQNAQNLRVIMERVDALTAQMQALHARFSGTAVAGGTVAPAGGAIPSEGVGMPPEPTATSIPGGVTAEGPAEAPAHPLAGTPPPIPPVSGGETVAAPGVPGGSAPVSTSSSSAEVPGGLAPPGAIGSPVASLGITPVTLYRRGHELLQEKNFAEARKVFARFLKEYPDHTYAGNAQYWLAETYYAEQNFEDAILAYEDVIRKYKGSDKVPGAMLKQGYSFLSLSDSRTAKVLLESVVRKYPDSEEAALARKKLAEIDKAPAHP